MVGLLGYCNSCRLVLSNYFLMILPSTCIFMGSLILHLDCNLFGTTTASLFLYGEYHNWDLIYGGSSG